MVTFNTNSGAGANRISLNTLWNADCDTFLDDNRVVVLREGKNLNFGGSILNENGSIDWGETRECTEITYWELCVSVHALRDELTNNHTYLWETFGSDIELVITNILNTYLGNPTFKLDPAEDIEGEGAGCSDDMGICCIYEMKTVDPRIIGIPPRINRVHTGCQDNVSRSDCKNLKGGNVDTTFTSYAIISEISPTPSGVACEDFCVAPVYFVYCQNDGAHYLQSTRAIWEAADLENSPTNPAYGVEAYDNERDAKLDFERRKRKNECDTFHIVYCDNELNAALMASSLNGQQKDQWYTDNSASISSGRYSNIVEFVGRIQQAEDEMNRRSNSGECLIDPTTTPTEPTSTPTEPTPTVNILSWPAPE